MYIQRSEISASCSNSILIFLRNCHTVFHSGCAISHSYQQCSSVPISSSFLPGLVIFCLFGLTLATLVDGISYCGFSLHWVSPMAQQEKNLPAKQETQEMQVRSLGREDPLEEEMATCSSILVWEIPWTEESCGLQSMGSQSWT